MVIENGILKYLEKKDVSDGILTIPKEVIEISSTFVDPVPWKLDDWHSGISRYGSKDVEWLEDTISITYKGKPEIKKVIFEKGSKLTKIDIGAFTNFRELEELELPDSVTEIGDWFCRKCTSLKKVKLPKKLKKIGENSFYNCHNLEYVFGSRETEGFNDLFQKSECVIEYTTEKRGNVLTTQNVESLKDNDNIIISGVKEIGANTFCGFKNVENIIIEEGVKIIGNYAFTGCENLKRVTLPNSLEYIGDSAFERCESLESIIITPPELNRNKDAFGASNSIVNLPSKIKFIGKKAFQGCEKITKVILPEKLKVLSDFMFNDCISLKNVEKNI